MSVEQPILRTFKMRLLPRKGQHVRLKAALHHTRDLYNAALQERVDAYRVAGETRSYAAQCAGLTALRQDPAYANYPVALQRWPLKKVDLAFSAFFSRVRRGEKPGYPRFKGADWFKSFGFTDRWGWNVVGRHLSIKGIGRVRMHMHRQLPGAPVSCQIKKDAKGWVALLVCAIARDATAQTGASIGVDLGIASFVATSDGATITGFKPGRRSQKEMRRRQRALARCKRGSNNRRKAKARVARLYEAIGNARRTFHHQVAARLVKANDLIAVENLNVQGLSRSILARDVRDAGWASFINLLAEKAEKAGRMLVRVDPRHTSQICPACGSIAAKLLSERVHRCDCGYEADRDIAAAQVILMRAVAGPLPHNVGGYAVRAV